MPKVLLHLHRAPDLVPVLPVSHLLRQRKGWQVALSLTPYDRDERLGLPPLWEQKARSLGLAVVEDPAAWKPDITLTLQPVEGILDGCGTLVRLPASLIAKGRRWTDRGVGLLDNLADLHLVPGPWHERRHREAGRCFVPALAVGHPAIDMLLSGKMPPRQTYMGQLGLDPGHRTLLYAPTWDPELSAVPLLWSRIAALVDDTTHLFVHLHPYATEEAQRMHAALDESHPNLHLVRSPDLTPYMQMCDVLVSDLSSVAFEFAALDKPVVLVDNPNRVVHPDLGEEDPELVFGDIGPHVDDLPPLLEAVEEALREPNRYAEARRRAAAQLLADRQGGASLKVVAALEEVMKGSLPARLERREPVLALLDGRGASPASIETSLESLLDRAGERVGVVLLHEALDEAAAARWGERWPESILLRRAGQAGPVPALQQAKYVVRLGAGVAGPDRWLFRLLNHLRRAGDGRAVVPCALGGAPSQDPATRFGSEVRHDVDADVLDTLHKVNHAGGRYHAGRLPREDAWAAPLASEAGKALAGAMEAGRAATLPPVEQLAVAADVVVQFAPWSLGDLAAGEGPLRGAEREEAERRVREMSEWIQRILPESLQHGAWTAPAQPVGEGEKPPRAGAASRDGGPGGGEAAGLRLVRHYEERGKLEQARRQLRRLLASRPGDAAVRREAERFGVSPAGPV